jgi:hypothetical protein
MRKAEEILAEILTAAHEKVAAQQVREGRWAPMPSSYALRAIESAQREAWNEAIEKAAKWALNFHIAPAPRSRAAQFHERNVKAILHGAIRSLHREEE